MEAFGKEKDDILTESERDDLVCWKRVEEEEVVTCTINLLVIELNNNERNQKYQLNHLHLLLLLHPDSDTSRLFRVHFNEKLATFLHI